MPDIVKDLPESDRPREKLIAKGPQALTERELIAILLRTGTKGKSVLTIASELISKAGGLSQLALYSIAKLIKENGIKNDKAATLAAAFEIGRRIDAGALTKNAVISGSKSVADYFIPILRDDLQEKFFVVSLTTAHRIIRSDEITKGTLNASLVHAREVFRNAIENSAAAIILLHNHPSGNIEPSPEDKRVTNKLVEAGKIIDIQVLDHLIIGKERYFSFSDAGLL